MSIRCSPTERRPHFCVAVFVGVPSAELGALHNALDDVLLINLLAVFVAESGELHEDKVLRHDIPFVSTFDASAFIGTDYFCTYSISTLEHKFEAVNDTHFVALFIPRTKFICPHKFPAMRCCKFALLCSLARYNRRNRDCKLYFHSFRMFSC